MNIVQAESVTPCRNQSRTTTASELFRLGLDNSGGQGYGVENAYPEQQRNRCNSKGASFESAPTVAFRKAYVIPRFTVWYTLIAR